LRGAATCAASTTRAAARPPSEPFAAAGRFCRANHRQGQPALRLILLTAGLAAGALALSACNAGSGDQEASERAVEAAGGQAPPPPSQQENGGVTTGAAGAMTGPNDPNPAGQGATTGATPGDATGSMGSTPTQPAPEPAAPMPK
jgi:hypothetical protein